MTAGQIGTCQLINLHYTVSWHKELSFRQLWQKNARKERQRSIKSRCLS